MKDLSNFKPLEKSELINVYGGAPVDTRVTGSSDPGNNGRTDIKDTATDGSPGSANDDPGMHSYEGGREIDYGYTSPYNG